MLAEEADETVSESTVGPMAPSVLCSSRGVNLHTKSTGRRLGAVISDMDSGGSLSRQSRKSPRSLSRDVVSGTTSKVKSEF